VVVDRQDTLGPLGEFAPHPHQQLELRRFNFRLRRA
jgi:hypothetical protein